MDTALTLRIAVENDQALSEEKILDLLNQSSIVSKLTMEYIEHPLFAVFRIVCLSEIPYAEKLPYTQRLLNYINHNIATAEGFSCLGGIKELVPCYNAMVLEAYSRLGLAASSEAQAALRWIKQYQLFERNQSTSWPYDGVCKHGGCLGTIPCYIGIGKTVRALITYMEFMGQEDKEVKSLIIQGVEYMLRHRMFQRLSDEKPISAHITDIMFPQNYALSLTDLVYIVGKRKLVKNENAAPLLEVLKEKEVNKNQWKIGYIYNYKGYVCFEGRRKVSEWISYLYSQWLFY